MHSLDEVRAEYDRLDKLLGIDSRGIELKVSTRAVKQLGCFKNGAKPSITLAKAVLEDDGLFLDTVRHEYAHAALWLMQPKERHGHDAQWKALCRRIGCVPKSRVKSGEKAAAQRAQRAKYLIRCTGCGAESLYLRRGKSVDMLLQGRGARLRCTRCGGNDFKLYVRE